MSLPSELYLMHVLIGTYELLPFCTLNGQMARRGSEYHVARSQMEDEQDCNDEKALLTQISLAVDHDALLPR